MSSEAIPHNPKQELLDQWQGKYQAVLQGPLASFRGLAGSRERLLDYNLTKKYGEELNEEFTSIPEVEAFLAEVGKVEDKEVASSLLHQDRQLFEHLNQEMRDDKEIAMYAVSNDAGAFAALNEELKNDEDVCLALAGDATRQVNNGWDMIQSIPEKFKNDRDFVLKFIARNPTQVYGVVLSTPFGKNTDVLFQAAEDALKTGISDVFGLTMGFSGVNLNKESIIRLIRNNPEEKERIIRFTDRKLREDPDILNA